MSTYADPTDAAIQIFGHAKEFRIERDGDRDLLFTGWEIGRGELSAYSLTRVRIYLTVGEKYVTHVQTINSSGDEERVTDERVAYHSIPWQALDWLKADNSGTLGAASKEAWRNACRGWPPIGEEEYEKIS